MSFIRNLASGLRALFRKEQVEQEMDEELRAYLDAAVKEKMRAGMTHAEARRAARVEMGSVESVKEEIRSAGWESAIEALWQDLRYGLRMLAKSPRFTAAAVITLAVGIGANTTIFSVAYRPMRYQDAGRLLMVWETSPDGSRNSVSAPTYLDWRDQNTCFEQLAAARSSSAALSGNAPTLVATVSVTPNFFATFRLRPELGRLFLSADFRPEAGKAAVLGHNLWQAQFGSDTAILGRRIRLNGEPYAVIGVAPAEFEFWGRTDVWTPLVLPRAIMNRQVRDLRVVGRMKPGVTTAQAREEVRTLAARVAQQAPATNQRWSGLAQNFHEALAGPGVHLMIVLLFAVVCVVLLMACSNVANLLLARGTTRRKEIAVRVAMGASRWRVMHQLLLETLLLALAGGTLGLLLAFGAVRYLATLPVLQAPGLSPIEINGVVLGFVVVLAVATSIFAGLVPAWQTTSTNLMDHVKSSGRNAIGDRGQSRLRHALVIAELALSIMLMVTAGLSVRSFIRLSQVDPGFPTRNLITAHLSLPAPRYADAGRARMFYSELLERVRVLPGGDDAAISSGLPPMTSELRQPFQIEGRDPASHMASGVANYQVISANYFRTLGLTVLKGRAFMESDRPSSTAVVVINRRLADRYFPSDEPLGKILLVPELVPGRTDPSQPLALEIVGVVEDVKNGRLNEPASPELYLSYLQAPWTAEYLVVRSAGSTGPLLAGIRNALRAVDPDLPMTEVGTMEERFSRALAGGRVVAALMAMFALLALAMGGVGLYGVISYSVAQRTNEYALRMALGAPRGHILRLVGCAALRLLLIGGTCGIALALAAARLLGGTIFGISPYDPATFITVALVLVAVVVMASYLPARRAMKVDPMVALRYE